MPKPEFKERRKFPRFTITISLTYSTLNSHKVSNKQTRDISAQGIGFITNEELAPHTPLDIWLNMPDNGEQIHARGEVIWSSRTALNSCCAGVSLKVPVLKPIPLVLRIIQTKL